MRATDNLKLLDFFFRVRVLPLNTQNWLLARYCLKEECNYRPIWRFYQAVVNP